jgi:hypothetical protein
VKISRKGAKRRRKRSENGRLPARSRVGFLFFVILMVTDSPVARPG